MNDKHGIAEALPASSVRRTGAISAIWLLPLLAIVLGGWLAYKHFTEAGVNIVVIFTTGEGVVAGKTEVRYKGTKVVTESRLNDQPNWETLPPQIPLRNHVEPPLRYDT